MSIKILSFGEMLLEQAGGKLQSGGSPLTLAANVCRLGGQAAMYSRIGADEAGEKLRAAAAKYGVDMSYVFSDDAHPTGAASIDNSIVKQGVPAYTLSGECSARHICTTVQSIEKLSRMNFDALCFQTLSQMFSQSHDTLLHILEKINVCEVYYDINLRGQYYSKKVFDSLFPHATIVRCTSDEMRLVSTILFGKMMPPREFAEQISKQYAVPLICVRQKGQGYAVYHAGMFAIVEDDTDKSYSDSGYGDAFNAAFLSLFCKGISPFESAKAGAEIARIAADAGQRIPEYSKNALDRIG